MAFEAWLGQERLGVARLGKARPGLVHLPQMGQAAAPCWRNVTTARKSCSAGSGCNERTPAGRPLRDRPPAAYQLRGVC